MIPRRYLLLLGVLLIAAGAAAGGWAFFAFFHRPVRVQVAAAQSNVPVQVFGLGTVEARVVSKAGFKVAGVLSELHADTGDCVAKGAVLARLDVREQSARVGRAKANVEQAEANLKRAQANAAKAKATHVNAKSINDRRQAMLKVNNVSVESAEASKAAFDICGFRPQPCPQRCRGGPCGDQ